MDPAATEEPLIAEDVKADICTGRWGWGGGSGREVGGEEGGGRGENSSSVLFHTCLSER